MKNYHSPASAALWQGLIKLNRVRVVLILALLAGLSCLPFYVFAQGDTVIAKKTMSYSVVPDRGSFVLYAGPNGETVCRDATPVETRAIRNGTSNGLRQINHLKSAASAESPTAVSATGLTIILQATPQLEANAPAKQAFIAAAAKWEALIKDPITVVVEVDFGTNFFGDAFDDPTIIGLTDAPLFAIPENYPIVRNQIIEHASPAEAALAAALPANAVPTDLGSVDTVFIGSPQLRAIGFMPADNANDNPLEPVPKPRIGFNSAFAFDFDPNDGINGDRTDFDAVAVHEVGHALGFASVVGDRELNPSDPNPISVTIWDLFRFRPGTANLGTFATAQRILQSGGTQVQFNGGPELGLSTGRADGSGGDTRQPAHWKDDSFGGSFIGIMDPTIPRNVREVMQATDQNAIDAFGYNLIAAPTPPNDNFANAQTVAGNSGSVNGTNLFSTKETGEPTHSPDGVFSGKSIWYTWTAPSSGTVTMTTTGSRYDTLLAIYTGATVGGLTLITRNDDDPAGSVLTSSVQFPAVGGTTYQIAVDGYSSADGGATFNWILPGGPTPTPTPFPNTVQFTVSTASANETLNATTHVDLVVSRTGNTAAAAKVDYASSDAVPGASERSDYEAARGTLNFAGGETSKTITVFIVDDRLGEGPETFNVTLSNPVACTLGAPVAVTVTINSNEDMDGTNPVKEATFNTDFFVRQHYLDFFNREPDASGLAFWKNQIDGCTTPQCREIRRINVSAAFFLSIEFKETGSLVYKTYQASFDTHEFLRLRDFLADTQEIGRGVVFGQAGADALLEANKVKFFNDFVRRATFLAPAAYPTTMSAAQFVDKLNANTRDPNNPGAGSLTPVERDTLVAQLSFDPTSVTLRAQVLRSIAENSVFHNRQFNRAFVLMQYFGYLRRNPNDPPELNLDFGGYNFWLGKLNQFNGNFIDAEMVKAFITSAEYQLRFGP